MDPNNNQQINTQQPQQLPVTDLPTQEQTPVVSTPTPEPTPIDPTIIVPTPTEPVTPASAATAQTMPVAPITPTPVTAPEPMPTVTPKSSGGGKGLALLIILLVLVLGLAAYVFFVKNQINIEQKSANNIKDVVVPTATMTPIPTPASVDEIQVEDPTTDLNSLDTDVSGL
jgi:hypothetical protein